MPFKPRAVKYYTTEEIATIKKCIVCDRYCTHEHHLVDSKNGGRKNIIPVCKRCHKKIHNGKKKIRVSRLPQESLNYILAYMSTKKVLISGIDWYF